MADKVVFRRGEESGLPAQGSIQPGSFYILTDTERLLYGKDQDNLIEFGAMPFEVGGKPPKNQRILWINTTPEIGGLMFYDENIGDWAHVPVAFTAKNPTDDNVDISERPASDDEYIPYGTYSINTDWKAPYTGWYKIEVFGASGAGGTPTECGFDEEADGSVNVRCYKSGGGGSGGYTYSIVALNKDDTVSIVAGESGSLTSAAITSTQDASYSITMEVESGQPGGEASYIKGGISYSGAAGAGGVVTKSGTGKSLNGNSGQTIGTGNFTVLNRQKDDTFSFGACLGGAAIVNSGTVGGHGAYIKISTMDNVIMGKNAPGQKGFVTISIAQIN